MRSKYFMYCFAAAFLSCVWHAQGAEEVPAPVKVSIVSDVSAAQPGKPFYLGVLFTIDPDWHIYWKNPGDSGLPTTALFKYPEGFKAGVLKWPVPKVFKTAGGIVDYGYEDSLLLFTEVSVPEGAESGSVIDLVAEVSWVSCERICIPGKARLELKLPVSHSARYVNTELFSEWRRALPLAATDKRNPFKIEISKAQKDETTEIVTLSLEAKNRERDIELCPVPGDSISVGNITYDSSGNGDRTDISFEVKSLSPKRTPDSVLEVLVVYTSPEGGSSGVELSIPLED